MPADEPPVKAISNRDFTIRLLAAPCACGLVCIAIPVFMPTACIAILLGIMVLLTGNSVILARRITFTDAIRNMRPLSEVDNDTLFPEEIDPFAARPGRARVLNYVVVQGFVVSGTWHFGGLVLVGML